MGIVLVAPQDCEKVVMGDDVRTEYRPRSRVVEVHKAHVSALKMMGFVEPTPDPIQDVAKVTLPTASEAAAIARAAAEQAAAEAKAAEQAKAQASRSNSDAESDAMNAIDLITAQDLRDWLNTASAPYPTDADPALSRLVTAVSAFATNYLQRNLQPTSYAENRNGNDSQTMILLNRPIVSVSSLTVDGVTIPPRPTPTGAGFVFDTTAVYLTCRTFCRGMQNVSVAYKAGLQMADVVTVPAAPGILGVAGLARHWNSDQGVVSSGGVAFTRVTTTPSVSGTYQVKSDSSDVAEYVFAAGDAGATVTITYGYTPEDIVQALVETACERYKSRNRIGETSQTFAPNMSTSFSQRDLSAFAKTTLDSYRNVVPVL